MATMIDWTKAKLNRAQALLTKAELKALPALSSTECVPLAEKKAVVHFFGGSVDFYAVEFDPATGLFFGFTKLGPEGEWGYQSAEELLSARYPVQVGPIRTRMPLERDLYFDGKLPECAA